MEKEEVRERLLYQPRFKRKHYNQPPVNWIKYDPLWYLTNKG